MASKPEKPTAEEIEQEIQNLQGDLSLLGRDERDAMSDFFRQRRDLYEQIKELRDLLSGDGH